MYVHQKVTMNIPTGGMAPQNLAMAIKRPHGPVVQKKFKSLKEAMMYLKERDEEDDEG